MSKSVDDVVRDVLEEINTTDITKDDKEVINQIKALIRELKGTGISGKEFRMYSADELSRIAGSLANLKASLADMHARALRNFRVSEAVIKLKKGNLREPIINEVKNNKGKATEGDIKAETDRRIFKDRIRKAIKEEFSERVVYTWRACNSMLDVILTRINVLQSQQSDTHVLDSSVEFDLPTAPKETNNPEQDLPPVEEN